MVAGPYMSSKLASPLSSFDTLRAQTRSPDLTVESGRLNLNTFSARVEKIKACYVVVNDNTSLYRHKRLTK